MEFENYTTKQKIEKITFDKLNLLVGRSGAGKTQILKTLSSYIAVASSESTISSIQFEGYFEAEFFMPLPITDDDFKERKVSWKIYTDKMKNIVREYELYRLSYGVSKEILLIDDEEIIHRTKDNLLINRKENVPISPEQSALSVFKNAQKISYIRANLFSIVSYYHQMNAMNDIDKVTFEQIKNQFYRINNDNYDSYLSKTKMRTFLFFYPVLIKIYVMKEYDIALFNEFLLRLQNIFPSIEDVKIDSLNDTNYFTLFIKENGKWISKESISSGMLKSIYILAITTFSMDGNVILLDELENSLGVNCLDEITSYIVNEADNATQFILTSHHPYIINNIPEKYWHIVSQNDGIISSKKANDVGISTVNNRQDRFFQLINYMQRQ